MSIVQLTTDFVGQVGVQPRLVRMVSTADYSTITTAGYLDQASAMGNPIYPTDFIFASYDGGFGMFNPSISGGVITLVPTPDSGGVSGSFTIGNLVQAQSVDGVIEDSGIASSDVIVNSNNSGQSITSATSSATPGTIRSIRGVMNQTATTMTSGNVVGVRGEVNCVSASGGFLYGVQGKVIPTGTLSGSEWTAGLFGQLDLSGATVNAGQLAAVWADMGAMGGTFTDVTGARMFAGTNTISSLTLNSMIYLYGKATNLFELSGSSSTYISSGGAGAPSGTIQKIAITIDGTTYYIVASTIVS